MLATEGLATHVKPSPSSLPAPPILPPPSAAIRPQDAIKNEANALFRHHARAIVPCSSFACRISLAEDTPHHTNLPLQAPPLHAFLYTTILAAWTALNKMENAMGIYALYLPSILPPPLTPATNLQQLTSSNTLA